MTLSYRKNLVVVRAGDTSLHHGWIAGPGRDFDLFISYYGSQQDLHRADADYYEMRRGPKWSCLAELLAEHGELLDRYDAFWFPDDDLAATTDTLNRMFALFHGFALSLAQPALTRDSYYTWKDLLEQPGCILRYTSFVEVMAPLFDRIALKTCLRTFAESRSGWGLDWVWPRLVGRGRPDTMAILDATPVRHTRPLGGDLYANNPDMDPHQDLQILVDRYGLEDAMATTVFRVMGRVVTASPRWSARAWSAFRIWRARKALAKRRRRAARSAKKKERSR